MLSNLPTGHFSPSIAQRGKSASVLRRAETDPAYLRLYTGGQTGTAGKALYGGRMVKCAAIWAALRGMGGRDLTQAQGHTSGSFDLSLGAGQQENVGKYIKNQAEPKPNPWTVAGVQGAVRREGGKTESEQDIKSAVNPRKGYARLIAAGTIRHAGLVRVGTQESPSHRLQPRQILSGVRKEFTLLKSMHRDPLSLHQINGVIRPHGIVAYDADFSRPGTDPGSDDLSVDHYSVRGLCRRAAGRALLCLSLRPPQRQAGV